MVCIARELEIPGEDERIDLCPAVRLDNGAEGLKAISGLVTKVKHEH